MTSSRISKMARPLARQKKRCEGSYVAWISMSRISAGFPDPPRSAAACKAWPSRSTTSSGCMQGVDLEGHAVACRSPRGVDYHAREVVSRVAHATPGLVAQCVESVALRYGLIKPGFALPHSTLKGPLPRENGGVGAIPRVSTDDSPTGLLRQ